MSLFFTQKVPKTKKEKARARLKKLHIILFHNRMHEENRRKTKDDQERQRKGKKSKALGDLSVAKKDQIGDNPDKWREKAANMRSQLRGRKEHARTLWQGR